MAHNSVKTVHHAKLELFRSLDLTFAPDDFSTLNEYFDTNIAPDVPAPTNITVGANTVVLKKYPTVKYLAVGNYPKDIDENLPPKHRPTDGSLFRHMPWVVRNINDPLTLATTPSVADYAMIVTIPLIDGPKILGNGLWDNILTLEPGYIYYFLRAFDSDATPPAIDLLSINNGAAISSVPMVITDDDLNQPVRVDITNANLNLVQGEHTHVYSEISIELNAVDIAELVAGMVHINGNDAKAEITEFGIVSAYPAALNGTDDVTFAQIVNFIGTYIPLQGTPNSINLTYSLGNTLPLPEVIAL